MLAEWARAAAVSVGLTVKGGSIFSSRALFVSSTIFCSSAVSGAFASRSLLSAATSAATRSSRPGRYRRGIVCLRGLSAPRTGYCTPAPHAAPPSPRQRRGDHAPRLGDDRVEVGLPFEALGVDLVDVLR